MDHSQPTYTHNNIEKQKNTAELLKLTNISTKCTVVQYISTYLNALQSPLLLFSNSVALPLPLLLSLSLHPTAVFIKIFIFKNDNSAG